MDRCRREYFQLNVFHVWISLATTHIGIALWFVSIVFCRAIMLFGSPRECQLLAALFVLLPSQQLRLSAQKWTHGQQERLTG